MKNFNKLSLLLTLCVAVVVSSCSKTDDAKVNEVVLANHSVTPALLKKMPGFENVEVFSLLSSDDKLPQSPNYVFGGSADGAGLLKDGDRYIMLVNHEDNFAVSRIILDKTFKPVKGEYLLNSTGGLWRLCSATLATREEHGFGPLFLTCGESGQESRTHALNPFDDVSRATQSRELPAFGRWSAENAVPLPAATYPNKTVILIGDDDFGSRDGGQVAMYVANSVGDLQNGSIHFMRRVDRNTREMDMVVGQKYPVEFVKIDNAATLTGVQIAQKTIEGNAIAFGRTEDLDYRKGSAAAGREIYFNTTGEPYSGTNADRSRTRKGRTYRLMLDANDPLKGTLEVILDGDDANGKAKMFQNPDNLMVTNNYVYIQEDPNTYGDETHDAYVYQYNIATGELKIVFELDHRRDAADAAIYNVGGRSRLGAWEYGAMIDISNTIGIENTYLLYPQPHTWRGDKYKNADGGTLRPNENQASQILVIKGLPK